MAVLAVADSDERHPRSLQAFPGLPASRPTLEPKPSAFCIIAPAHVHTYRSVPGGRSKNTVGVGEDVKLPSSLDEPSPDAPLSLA